MISTLRLDSEDEELSLVITPTKRPSDVVPTPLHTPRGHEEVSTQVLYHGDVRTKIIHPTYIENGLKI
jgi:hypothetical protein